MPWSIDQVAPNLTEHWEGIYQAKGNHLCRQFHAAEPLGHVTWSIDERGDLHFDWIDGPSEAVFHVRLPWVRVD